VALTGVVGALLLLPPVELEQPEDVDDPEHEEDDDEEWLLPFAVPLTFFPVADKEDVVDGDEEEAVEDEEGDDST
jgi:hypothetical protein